MLLLVPSVIFAQDATVEDAVSSAPGTVLAQINLSNAEVVQVGNEATVTFLVENLGTKPETDLQYGLEILKTDEDGAQALVDVLVQNDTRTVAPGAPLEVKMNYSTAHLAAGTYQVWAQARTPGGLMVGIALVGEVTTAGTDALEIATESCLLSIPGVEKQYYLSDGVDVAPAEELTLTCVVKNHGAIERQIVPEFVTYERTVYGEVVGIEYPTVSELTLAPGEEKEVALVLPKAAKPQAYDLVVSYADVASQIVSNKAVVHYVLQGQSATLQAINFDKNAYAAGETMTLSILWSESADTFPDSRSGGTKKTEIYYFDTVVTSADGQVCTNDRRLVEADDLIEMQLVSTVACTNPTASVSLQTSTGAVLDTQSVTIVPEEVAPSVVPEDDSFPLKPTKQMFAIIGLFAVIGVVLVMWQARKNHIVADGFKLLVGAVITGAGLFGGAVSAEAVTWTLRSTYEDCGHWDTTDGSCVTRSAVLVTATVNTNKTTYAPGETIYLSGQTQNHACSNLYYGISARLAGNAELTFFEGRASGVRGLSGTFRAPTTPGNYTIGLGVCHTNINNCASASINITVANPAVNGRCHASHYRCSAGTSANNSNNPTNYTWRCNGLNGGTTASCSEAKINAVCSVANTCAPGNLSAPTQSATQYFWNCLSPNGGSNTSCSAYIPPTVNLTAAPDRMGPGGSSNLSWTITNATTCTASGGWSGSKSNTAGTEEVRPTATTVYTLTCTGPGGTVSDSATVTMPSGTLTATSCTIAPEGTGCSSTVRWSSANFLGATNLLLGAAVVNTAASNMTGQAFTVNPSNRTFRLDDVGSAFELITMADVTCSGNSMWADSVGQCISRPIITIDADPDVIRSGETADVSVVVDSPYDLTCTLRGGLNVTFPHNGSVTARQPHDYTTNPLTAAQITEITCEVDDFPGVETTVDTRINVVPTIEEI